MRFSHLVNGNNRGRLADGRNRTEISETIKDVKKEIHARAREVLQHGIGDSVWGSSGGR